jgi:hypothetical protein
LISATAHTDPGIIFCVVTGVMLIPLGIWARAGMRKQIRDNDLRSDEKYPIAYYQYYPLAMIGLGVGFLGLGLFVWIFGG